MNWVHNIANKPQPENDTLMFMSLYILNTGPGTCQKRRRFSHGKVSSGVPPLSGLFGRATLVEASLVEKITSVSSFVL